MSGVSRAGAQNRPCDRFARARGPDDSSLHPSAGPREGGGARRQPADLRGERPRVADTAAVGTRSRLESKRAHVFPPRRPRPQRRGGDPLARRRRRGGARSLPRDAETRAHRAPRILEFTMTIERLSSSRSAVALTLFVVALLAGRGSQALPARAAAADAASRRAMLDNIGRNVLAPAYADLAAKAAALSAASDALAAAPAASTLVAAQESWRQTLVAWRRAQLYAH